MTREAVQGRAKPTVVIVDDDPAVRGALAFSLQTEGFLVRSYASGADLLVDLPITDESCMVIDYRLPGMNGLDLLAELRRRHVAAPAILITTHPSAALRERAVRTGMALIEKPLLGDALFAEIRAAFVRAK
jgi:two-component system, LuxR family, response regulator FixJ